MSHDFPYIFVRDNFSEFQNKLNQQKNQCIKTIAFLIGCKE